MNPRSDFEFEPAAPGTWPVVARAEANHEAAHALAVYLLDGELEEVRIDRPDENVLGHVRWRVRTTKELWKHLPVALAPLILTGRCPNFPPSLHSDDGDEQSAAQVCYGLQMTEDDYTRYVEIITGLMSLSGSKRALTALSGALLERGALSGKDALRILKDAEKTHIQDRKGSS